MCRIFYCQLFCVIYAVLFLPSQIRCCHPEGRALQELIHVLSEKTFSYELLELWGGQCQTGQRQSPIDIRKEWFAEDKTPPIQFVNYEKQHIVKMHNNGHTVFVNGFNTWPERPFITDGGLGSIRYLLDQFHFHWSQNGDGSEHTVDGQHFDAELHLVHIKEGLTLEEALRTPDGLAVVGIFYKTASTGLPLVALQNALTQVTKTDASIQIDNCVLSVLLPTVLNSFFRYNGSLTTPGCNEAVVWSVYEVPRFNNAELIQLLRTIQREDGNLIRTNVRPVQTFSRRA
ncbi:hypothetical protein niasHT_013951 [Heterodera trifolii]|uniref:Carbonic anhydrase n=1 Tax=Heterodera trifolii TaxID=157864 RepID=A0ABD2L1X0_9BILA